MSLLSRIHQYRDTIVLWAVVFLTVGAAIWCN